MDAFTSMKVGEGTGDVSGKGDAKPPREGFALIIDISAKIA